MFDLRIDRSNLPPKLENSQNMHRLAFGLQPLLDVISLQLKPDVQIRGERVQGTHGRRSRGRTSPTRPSAWRVYSGLAKAGCVYVHATARELPLRFVLALHALIAQSD